MKIFELSKDNYTDVPRVDKFANKNTYFDAFVLVPTGKMHDSGYACMSVIGCLDEEAVCRFSGWSDVIHLDGIGGYGEQNDTVANSGVSKAWKIDCTPNGFARIFCRGKLRCGDCVCSDFDVYSVTEIRGGGEE